MLPSLYSFWGHDTERGQTEGMAKGIPSKQILQERRGSLTYIILS